MKKYFKRVMAVLLAVALATTPAFGQIVWPESGEETKAEQKGKLATEVTGHWSYWDGQKEVIRTNASLLDNLPTIANKGKTRFTTDNYDASNKAFLTNGWSTSMGWNYSKGDAYGNAVYAIPMAYAANGNGMSMINPFVRRDATSGVYLQNTDSAGTLSDWLIGTGATLASTKVDAESDWSTRVRMEESADSSKSIDFTMTQGSPFTYCTVNGKLSATITTLRNTLESKVISFDGPTAENSNMIVIRKFDNGDDAIGLTNYDYYALYLPNGATSDIKTSGSDLGKTTITFPSVDKAYFTFAWLCESKGTDDSKAISIAQNYKKYAYNFIVDTKATYNYDASTSKVTTNYDYTLENKAESTATGTIIGVIPHQYKNMNGYTYLSQTSKSIRGTVKFLEGTGFKTEQKYSGILPGLGKIEEGDKAKIKEYVAKFMEDFGPTETAVTKEKYDINTYDCGKKLNRAVQVMLAAEAAGDTENATKLLNGIKAELADWFTATGTEEDKYFYYDKNMGTLFGFPQAYYTVDGMTDHAFHYGYFINAVAQVALRDIDFVNDYKNVIDELVGDIATVQRNSSSSKYPYLRQFDVWEGHSWASGHGDFGDGNNQESSSEAMNGWAGLILYGQATHNKELTDTGIYLYTTESEAIHNYWFDTDGDVLSPIYTKNKARGMDFMYVSMLWGGKYGYETWWTAEPLQTNGINILPNTAASFYLAKDKNYMARFVDNALSNEDVYTGEDKDPYRWNELYAAYIAMYDPGYAESYFNDVCEAEAGDSKAHAYYQIKYMQSKGTPDLTTTSNMPMSMTFVKNGQATYAVYNPENTDKTVTFSDGTTFTAKANQLTEYSKDKPTTTQDPSAPTTTPRPTQPIPTTVQPEPGYKQLHGDLYYKIVDVQTVGMNGPEWLPDPVVQWAFAMGQDKAKVYINGVETSSGIVVLVANNIVKINPNALPQDAYTNIKIVTSNGDSEYILKKGNPVQPTTEPGPTVEPTTVEPTTVQPTTQQPTTQQPTVAPTTQAPTVQPTTAEPGPTTAHVTTTFNPRPTPVPTTSTKYVGPTTTTKKSVKKPGKAKIKKIYKKKKSAKKLKVKIKKLKYARGYQVAVFKSKKNAKKAKKALVKKYTKKTKYTIKSKKLKNKKKLYVRVRGYNLDSKKKIFGKWSKVKKVKIKK